MVSAATVMVSKLGMGPKMCASCPVVRREHCYSHLVFCHFGSLFLLMTFWAM